MSQHDGHSNRTLPTDAIPPRLRYLAPAWAKNGYQFRHVRRRVRQWGGRWRDVEAVFVHIPKTGGTSVTSWLRQTGLFQKLASPLPVLGTLDSPPRFLSTGHLDPGVLIRLGLMERVALDDAYSFALARNPYSRLVSGWRFLKRLGWLQEGLTLSQLVGDLYRHRHLADRGVAGRHLLGHPGLLGSLDPHRYRSKFPFHLLPQAIWLRPLLWQGPREVFRVEELPAAAEPLKERFRLESPIPHLNPSAGPLPAIDRAMADRIRTIYAADFEILGYPEEVPDRYQP